MLLQRFICVEFVCVCNCYCVKTYFDEAKKSVTHVCRKEKANIFFGRTAEIETHSMHLFVAVFISNVRYSCLLFKYS